MTGVLAASMAAVVVYCLARAAFPRLRPPGHDRAMDAGHVLMGLAMAGMLLVPFGRWVSALLLALAVLGVGWSCVRAVRRLPRARHLRLVVGCLAMAVMLAPAATASAASGPAAEACTMTGRTMAGHTMTGHTMTGHQLATAGSSLTAPFTLVLLVLLVALGLILAGALIRTLRSSGLACRGDSCCEIAMASAMGFMLVAML